MQAVGLVLQVLGHFGSDHGIQTRRRVMLKRYHDEPEDTWLIVKKLTLHAA